MCSVLIKMLIYLCGPLVFTASMIKCFYCILSVVFIGLFVSIFYFVFSPFYTVYSELLYIVHFMTAIHRSFAQYGTCWPLHSINYLSAVPHHTDTFTICNHCWDNCILFFLFLSRRETNPLWLWLWPLTGLVQNLQPQSSPR